MLPQLPQSWLNLPANIPLQVPTNSLPREPQAEQRLLSPVVEQNLSQAALALKVLVSKQADNEKFNAGRQETALKSYRSGHRTQSSSTRTSGSSLPCPAWPEGPKEFLRGGDGFFYLCKAQTPKLEAPCHVLPNFCSCNASCNSEFCFLGHGF